MKPHQHIKLTSRIIIGLAILFVGLTYFAFWIEGFTAIYILLFVGLIGVVLIGLIGRRIITVFLTKKYKLLTPSIVGLLALTFVIFRPIERIRESLKSPVVFVGVCEHTVTQTSITLRKDSTFEYNAGAFLAIEMYYGKYHINKDTLILYFNQKHPENLKEKLLFVDDGLLEIADSNTVKQYFKPILNKLTP